MLFEHQGYCPICEAPTRFVAEQAWLRDHYLCVKCRSIPRQRALVQALNLVRPDWKTATIHESSPSLWFSRPLSEVFFFLLFRRSGAGRKP